jgi:hypothetical protein
MKKFLCSLIVVAVAVTTLSFIPSAPAKPKLFPAIEKYFASVGNVSIPEKHNLAIKHLEVAITSSLGAKDVSILFTCTDNSFRSQAAQVMLQSLLVAGEMKRVSVVSAGNSAGVIDPRLITLLSSAGYKVFPTTINGKSGYEVTFGEKLPPILIYAKSTDDSEVKKAAFYLFKTCNPQESGCGEISGALYKDQLNYENPAEIKDEKALQAEFDTIAKEMSYTVAECLK